MLWSGFIFGEKDQFVLACNTAHLLVPELERRLGIRFVSLIESTVEEIMTHKIQKTGLLASPTTIRSGLYKKPLQVKGIEVMEPSQVEITALESAIRSIIAGIQREDVRQLLEPVICSMHSRGAESVLLGCTELSTIFPEERLGCIDPLQIITNRLMEGYTLCQNRIEK